MNNFRVFFFFFFFFLSENVQFLEVKFSIYFNRRVFVMIYLLFTWWDHWYRGRGFGWSL